MTRLINLYSRYMSFLQTLDFLSLAIVLLSFLINLASNVAEMLLITDRKHLTETCYILYISVYVYLYVFMPYL